MWFVSTGQRDRTMRNRLRATVPFFLRGCVHSLRMIGQGVERVEERVSTSGVSEWGDAGHCLAPAWLPFSPCRLDSAKWSVHRCG